MILPKLIITDIDGVWTDGSMYYDNELNELKRFSTYDGAGVVLSHQAGIPVAIMTGEKTKIVKRRAEKLRIDYLYQGVRNKVECAKELCQELDIGISEVAYLGDDFNDYKLLQVVGLSACPSNAHDKIKEIVDWQLKTKGGEGVFREFVEEIFRSTAMLDELIKAAYGI